MLPRLLPSSLLCISLLAVSCSPEPDPIQVLSEPGCEGTNPLSCLLPWPSSRWLEEDSSTETGLRLQYEAGALPANMQGEPFDVEPYSFRDGFSPASSILTVFVADVDVAASAGLATEGNWDLSLAQDSPTVILDLQTGERIAHFAEVDARAHEDETGFQMAPEKALFYLRPAARLEEDRSYAVAIRGLTLIDGSQAEAFDAFAALRDGQITTSPGIEARREDYEAMFAVFEEAGVDRASLTQAWRFHTASGSNLRGDLLAMRDDAMERIPVGGGTCTVTEVREDFSDDTFRRVDGTFTVPLYMDSPNTGSRVVRGPDGLPEFQGWTEAPFTVLIPHSVAAEGADAGRLLAFGHGLMGSGSGEGGGSFLRSLGNDYGIVTVATDWQGMSEEDLTTVGQALANISSFPSTGERLMQGVLNNLVMIRSFKGACSQLPELQVAEGPSYSTEDVYWLGISQGGIMGGTVMALTQDLTHGALLVGGMSYPVMIGRSVDFYDYEILYRVWYPSRFDRELLMHVMISMWDYAEPNAWLPHLVQDPLPDTPAKQILYQVARHDSQVPNIASDAAVRTMGLQQLAPSLLDIWGIEEAEGPLDSALVYYDLDREPPPAGNEAPTEGNGAHGDQRWLTAAMEQMNALWQPDGQVISFCEGPCDPE